MRSSWPGVFAAVLALIVSGAAAAPAHAESEYSSGIGLCIQPSGGLEALNGDVIVQVDRDTCINRSDKSMFWRIQPVRDSGGFLWFQMVNVARQRCLDLTDGNTADGTPLQLWTCNTISDTDLWAFTGDGNGKTRIINKKSRKCVDVQGGSDAPGTVIQNWHCASTTTGGRPNLAQQWSAGPL